MPGLGSSRGGAGWPQGRGRAVCFRIRLAPARLSPSTAQGCAGATLPASAGAWLSPSAVTGGILTPRLHESAAVAPVDTPTAPAPLPRVGWAWRSLHGQLRPFCARSRLLRGTGVPSGSAGQANPSGLALPPFPALGQLVGLCEPRWQPWRPRAGWRGPSVLQLGGPVRGRISGMSGGGQGLPGSKAGPCLRVLRRGRGGGLQTAQSLSSLRGMGGS